MREAVGKEVDIAIDFHGRSARPWPTAHQGRWNRTPDVHRRAVQCQNHDMMAEIARKTHLPIATGERVFTKWGFREVLENRPPPSCSPTCATPAASSKCRLIAGMAEAYYAADRAAQPARADFAGRRHPTRRGDPELPLPGASHPRRGLSEESRSSSRTASSNCQAARAWASSWTKRPSRHKSRRTTGRTP